jgi:hypothetical protein
LFFEELAEFHIELTICAFFIRFHYVVEARMLLQLMMPWPSWLVVVFFSQRGLYWLVTGLFA